MMRVASRQYSCKAVSKSARALAPEKGAVRPDLRRKRTVEAVGKRALQERKGLLSVCPVSQERICPNEVAHDRRRMSRNIV